MDVLLFALFAASVRFVEAPEPGETRPVEIRVATWKAALRPRNQTAGRTENAWRYVLYQGRWWYWSASERWSYFDGARWVKLDSLKQPLASGGNLPELVPRPFKTLPRTDGLYRFGELPVPRSRAGGFDVEGGTRVIGRNFAGSFEAGTASPHAVLMPPGEPSAAAPNPYGPGSIYGPYGSTNPFRGGLRSGAGGNYGYGLGTQRPATVGGYGKTTPHAGRP